MITENNTHTNPSIEEAKQNLLRELDKSIEWYTKNSDQRGCYARRLRFWMIIFGGISAIIPILSQIKICEKLSISPLWAPIFMTFTATLFAFEKFYGHSDAWMRFTFAKQELLGIKEIFLLTCLKNSPADPTVDELIRLSKERHLIIKNETAAWTNTFENGLKSSNPTVTSTN